MALKSARIVDFCGKPSGLADFENTVDRGSAVIFDANSGLCRSSVWILGPKQNLDHRSFFSLSRNVNEFIQIIISFFERSSFKLKGETVFGIVRCYWAKLTVVFTCTRLPLKLNTSVFGCGCSFGLAKQRHGSADLHTPIRPLKEHKAKFTHSTDSINSILRRGLQRSFVP